VLVLAAACVAALLVCKGRLRNVVWAGLALALLAYLPSSSLLVPLTRYLADSYLYASTLGLGLVAGALLERAYALSPRLLGMLTALPWLIGIMLVPAFLAASARFSSDLALWAHARGRFPHHPRICRQWSNAVVEEVGPSEGLATIDACISLFGDELFAKNRGLVLVRLGRFAEAQAWLRRAYLRDPDPAIAKLLSAVDHQNERSSGPDHSFPHGSDPPSER
jgi:hypothetical protein